jgi:hypothetical protein
MVKKCLILTLVFGIWAAFIQVMSSVKIATLGAIAATQVENSIVPVLYMQTFMTLDHIFMYFLQSLLVI